MKSKILGILVVTLLIATALPAVGTMIKYEQPTEPQLSISIEIVEPKEKWLYFAGIPIREFKSHPGIILPIKGAFIIGKITFQVNVSSTLPIECVDWYVDGIQEEQYTSQPYDWSWGIFSGFPGEYTVEVEVIDDNSNSASDSVRVLKIF